MHPEEFFAAVLFMQFVLLSAQPEGGINVVIVVVCVQADIFGEISKRLLIVAKEIVASVVGEQHQIVNTIHFFHTRESPLLLELSTLNHIKVEEMVGENLINGWQIHTGKILSMCDSDMQCINEESRVHIVTSPQDCLVECIPICFDSRIITLLKAQKHTLFFELLKSPPDIPLALYNTWNRAIAWRR